MSSIVQHAPRFSRQDAVRIAKDFFGIDAAAEQLPSERDQNFHLTDSSGPEYVLKLANATERCEMLEFQNQAMMHIAAKRDLFGRSLPVVPQVGANRQGEHIGFDSGGGGRRALCPPADVPAGQAAGAGKAPRCPAADQPGAIFRQYRPGPAGFRPSRRPP